MKEDMLYWHSVSNGNIYIYSVCVCMCVFVYKYTKECDIPVTKRNGQKNCKLREIRFSEIYNDLKSLCQYSLYDNRLDQHYKISTHYHIKVHIMQEKPVIIPYITVKGCLHWPTTVPASLFMFLSTQKLFCSSCQVLDWKHDDDL